MMEREGVFSRDARFRRNLTYVMWMLSVAFLLIGFNFALGSALQMIFLSLSVGLFVMSRSISTSLRSR